MAIAISDDHRALGQTAAEFLRKRDARGAARSLLEADTEVLPPFWDELVGMGWLGLHVPEEYGGSGFGFAELVVVVEELGRAVAPGPFVSTVLASAVLAAAAPAEVNARLLPGLADGSTIGAVGVDAEVEVRDGLAFGSAPTVIGAGLAQVVVVPVGEDVAAIDLREGAVLVGVPQNLDPTRRCGRVAFEGAAATVVTGAGRNLRDLSRLVLAAEATGLARECTELAADYAKARQQFGRPIGTYQAVKHHCANMLVATELATAAVWDAARAASDGADQLFYSSAAAAAIAAPAADLCAQLNIQVHGGIGFTWEHDAHLYLRRAAAILAVIDADRAAADVTDLARRGVRRARAVDLPAEAEALRVDVGRFLDGLSTLDDEARREALLEAGYLMPHWPSPWGRDAGGTEQLVIEQEFAAAGIDRPDYGITAWIILTLIQHATEDQISRWVRPALKQQDVWCQLFSEPDAGSDAAGIKTRAIRRDGGWLVTGQKVWTSGARVSRYGFATVRTNPDAPKHQGITTMVIDMKADGVEVRPLRMPTGNSEFNEVFLTDVFVPDDDVVGPVNSGWTVARATLGNESVSIGSRRGGGIPPEALIAPLDAHPGRLADGPSRVGRHLASSHAVDMLNLRSAHRAVHGGEPGPEGSITKLVLSENGHEAAAILAALAGPDGAYLEGDGAASGMLILGHRSLSIAGGTSEIKRNQIAERILGLPRDPLVK